MLQSEISFNQVCPFKQRAQVKQIWNYLEPKASASFYLSWRWMDNWLSSLDGNENLQLIYARYQGEIVFCYFLGFKSKFDHKIIYAQRAYLNQLGDSLKDSIITEHNGILIDKAFEKTGFLEVFEKRKDWSELVAKFVSPAQRQYFEHKPGWFTHWLEEDDKAFKIDLNQVRNNHNDLLPLLSKNKRSQIRRSIREYQQLGELRVEIPNNKAEANQAFAKLKAAHQASWQAKGAAGGFSSQFCNDFHDRLVKSGQKNNDVEILTVYAGSEMIGSLYNFIYRNTVYFYQSGLSFSDNNKLKPGLVTHLLAVNHYAQRGFESYDLLVGEMDYKKSLGSNAYLMPCYRLRKQKLRFALEDKLRQLKNRVSQLRNRQ